MIINFGAMRKERRNVRTEMIRPSQISSQALAALLFLAAFTPVIDGQYLQQRQLQYAAPVPTVVGQHQRTVARGYSTNQNVQPLAVPSMAVGTALVPTEGPVAQPSLTGGYDINPALLGGQRGNPGIRARINARGFQYFSTILTPILVQQIRRARIPNINQCIPQVNGCIQVYNLYVSRFRCPQRVVLYPAPPNQIVLAIENLDIGVTGNLGGQINIILPIGLFGIVQMNAHQLSARVSIVADRGPTGAIALRVSGCQVTVGYVDVYVENGGLIGDIANSQFRGRISEMVRSMLPSQLCTQIPSIVNEQLNGKLTSIPQSIQLSQLLQVALNAFGVGNLLGGAGGTIGGPSAGGQCPCQRQKAAAAPHGILLPHHQSALLRSLPTASPMAANVSQLSPIHVQRVNVARLQQQPQQQHQQRAIVKVTNEQPSFAQPVVHISSGSAIPRPVQLPKSSKRRAGGQSVDSSAEFRWRQKRAALSQQLRPIASARAAGVAAVGGPLPPPPPQISEPDGTSLSGYAKGQLLLPPPGTSPCNCPASNSSSDSPLAIISVILQSLDFSKLSNIYLTVQFLQGYATVADYTIDLNGEFSPGGQGGTPFGAFPMQFPSLVGHKMAEILISDWTVNTLFYQLHRVGFISIRIGPDTPKIGDLLKTTCSSDEDGLEDHGVETDGGDSTRRRRRSAIDGSSFTNFSDVFSSSTGGLDVHRRLRRQDAGALGSGSLSDLGICLGDILPAVREKHPNQKIIIHIHTARAPSVLLSARNGGTATLDFVFDADMHIQATNEKVGTIQIAATIDFTVRTAGGRISAHADITNLQLRDLTGSLGLPQDGLDNLGNLGKELLLKAGNEALEKGAPLSLPANLGGLPISFVDPEVRIVEHALHLAADFTIDPSGLSRLGLGGNGGGSC